MKVVGLSAQGVVFVSVYLLNWLGLKDNHAFYFPDGDIYHKIT